MLGLTQSMSALGAFLVTGVYFTAVTFGESLPAINGSHAAWRYTYLFGALPAIPVMLLRPLMPESPIWEARKSRRRLERPRVAELFAPALWRTTLVTMVLAACTVALTTGALQHVVRLVPELPGVADLVRREQEQIVSLVHLYADVGQLAGRLAFAALAVIVLSRQRLLRGLQLAALVVYVPALLYAGTRDLELLKVGMFLMSALVCMQLSFWGNYLPRVYPTHLRGTGESFAANIGGRMLGSFAALLTTQLSNVMPGEGAGMQLARSAALVAGLICAVALAASFALPEPKQERLDE